MPKQNGSGALNAMRSSWRETKDIREIERATRDGTETGRAGKNGREMRSERTILADHSEKPNQTT